MEAAQTLALMIAGVVGVPIINLIKGWFKLSDKPAFFIAIIVSIVIAVVSAWTSGIPLATILSDPNILFGGSGLVFLVTQAVFKSIKPSTP